MPNEFCFVEGIDVTRRNECQGRSIAPNVPMLTSKAEASISYSTFSEMQPRADQNEKPNKAKKEKKYVLVGRALLDSSPVFAFNLLHLSFLPWPKIWNKEEPFFVIDTLLIYLLLLSHILTLIENSLHYPN